MWSRSLSLQAAKRRDETTSADHWPFQRLETSKRAVAWRQATQAGVETLHCHTSLAELQSVSCVIWLEMWLELQKFQIVRLVTRLAL